MNQPLPHSLQSQFAELVASRTGLRIPSRDLAKLQKNIAGRMKCLQLSDAQAYYEILAQDGEQSRLEWAEFTGPLTTGESYFFRDAGQFTLLRNHILPEIINRNRQRRSLRIWSAGCSTGEEPYSLAILVAELLPEYKNWAVFLLGTDINQAAVATARRGTYSLWSLRGVPQDIKTRYFRPCPQGWELDARIRSLAHFRQGNLFRDAFPSKSLGIHDLDLIVCRNVFIYFDREAISAVLGKFSQALHEHGYLLTGHTEVYGLPPGDLHARRFPDSLIYQREKKATTSARDRRALAPNEAIVRTSAQGRWPHVPHTDGSVQRPLGLVNPEREPLKLQTALQEAEHFVQSGNYRLALTKLERLLDQEPRNLRGLTISAQAHASLGHYDEATRCCQQAITADSLAVLPYYLLAHITEHQGDRETAKTLFKKILYLDPAFTPAYLELGALYDREGDTNRARKMRVTALDFLNTLPPHTVIEAYGTMTAGELVTHVEKMFAKTRSPEL